MKIAICVTGGYYYNWGGRSLFYDWLYNFCRNNLDFEPHIISWQKKENVPDLVQKQFQNKIHYRDNNGCDWGCYNYFVNYLKDNDLREQYDYIIFCHDDILSRKTDWPIIMTNHILESLACKIPTYVCKNGGGSVELAGKENTFTNIEDFMEKIIGNKYYKSDIINVYGWSKCMEKIKEVMENEK
jgi:hypothetical protein